MIDFVACCSAMRGDGERALEAFYERVPPFAHTCMALFGRERLPHRSTERPLSRGPGSSSYRSMTYVVSRRSLGSPAGKIGEARRVVGSTKKSWCFPKEADANCVHHMEDVLDVYCQPYDPSHPRICMDEIGKN